MPRLPRAVPLLPFLAVASLVASACATQPPVTEPPPTAAPSATAEATPPPSEVSFEPAAWPATGSACDVEGYTGRMGRIEAPDARTVRFSLCSPDGAFLARIADPALGILDAAALERLAADPASARSLAGTGPYRIDAWDEGDGVVLSAVDGDDSPASTTPTLVLRWAADSGQRTLELQSATVDGMDGPGPLDLDRIETLPELTLTPRAGMATSFLAFGNDEAFDDPRVRRAIAGSIDRAALAAAAFPAGSVAPTHLTPCVVPAGCVGEPWYPFNGPAAVAELQAAGFDLDATYTLHAPARPVAGLPDPQAAAEALQAQLRDNLGLDVTIDVSGNSDLVDGAAEGSLDGLYLWGVGSSVADPSAFLGPVFGPGVETLPAKRTSGVREALAEAGATGDRATREAAFGRANDAVRDAAAIVPLVSPGSLVAFRSDVAGVATSPLGTDPLGAFTPGDRPQLVFMQAEEPTGAYCGDQRSADALRLCALVTAGLYGFAPGTLDPEPRMAERCQPNDDATVWTCTLRDGVAFHDGSGLDAGDVLASYAAQWDAGAPLRAARPDATFGAWRSLFGASLEPSPAPG